jgi:hypothetical protein
MNDFIPLTKIESTQVDGLFLAYNEASRIARPFQGDNNQSMFFITHRDGVYYGAIRNTNLAGSRQEELFTELTRKSL